MARLIVKSPYIQCSGGQSADGYLRYIATRERVEILPDDRPPTRKQEQLIVKLVKDFPDTKGLLEYEEDGVDLDKAMAELEHYTGNVWTHILPFHREDATRLGYDNARAWRALLRTHRNDIAAAIHIPPQNFRWYAAFHDEGEHPHVHMMAWSAKPGEGYLSKDGTREIKSALTNQIFRQEMLHVYEQKSKSRDELVQEAREAMLELSRQMGTSESNGYTQPRKTKTTALRTGWPKNISAVSISPKTRRKQRGAFVKRQKRTTHGRSMCWQSCT